MAFLAPLWCYTGDYSSAQSWLLWMWDLFGPACNNRYDCFLECNRILWLTDSWFCIMYKKTEEPKTHFFLFFCLQITSALQKKTSTWSTSPDLRSVTWKRGLSSLRSPNLRHQVSSNVQKLDNTLYGRSKNLPVCQMVYWFISLIGKTCTHMCIAQISRARAGTQKADCFLLFLFILSSAGGKKQCDPNAGRFVRYQFTPAFLQLRQVGAT